MKVLIIGSSGLVGRALFEKFSNDHDVIGTFNSGNFAGGIKMDIRDKSMTQDIIRRLCPNLVLQPASLTAVDLCEGNRRLAWEVNVVGTRNVAAACAKGGIKLVYFSSDYVFDGKDGPYKEEDELCPVNYYGRTKLEAEQVVQEIARDYLILRVSGLYGWDERGSNYVMQVYNALKAGERIKAAVDLKGKPTFVGYIADTTYELIERKRRGVYHIAGRDILSRFEIATGVATTFKLDKRLISKTKAEALKQRALRPLNSILDTQKIEKELGERPMGFREGLLNMRGELH